MEPIHKFNNGRGAMLCNGCRTIISTGPRTEELLCEKCKQNKYWFDEMGQWITPGEVEAWKKFNEQVKKEVHFNRGNLND